MRDKVKVELWLHPLAWKVLQRDYPCEGGAAEAKGWLYNLVCQGLRRRMVVTASEVRRQRRGLVQGAVLISVHDYHRYGGYLWLSRQANISTALYRQERDRLAWLAAITIAATGQPSDKVIRQILESEGIEEEELTFEALKKHYQRHGGQIEERSQKIISDLND